GGDADVDAAGDHRLHGLAAAAGEQQFEVEVVLAENAGALAQRGRTPCHFSRCPTAILSLSAAKAGMVASHPAMAAARQCPALWITAALIAVAPSAPWENLRPRRRPPKRLLGVRVVMEKPQSSRGVGQEFQGHAVDAVAQSRGRRAVLEDMAQMSAAAPAMHLGAWQQQQVVGGGANGVRQRPIEARPAGLAVVFGFRREQRKIAARAGKRALALLVVERARARGFGAVPPQDVVLRLLRMARHSPSLFWISKLSAASTSALHS